MMETVSMSMSSDLDPKQGEVWMVDFTPQRGAEISKMRPAIVVSADEIGRLPLRIVVPVTEWKDKFAVCPWFTEISPSTSNGLMKLSGADGFQIKSMSCERFNRRLGWVSASELEDIILAITFCLGR